MVDDDWRKKRRPGPDDEDEEDDEDDEYPFRARRDPFDHPFFSGFDDEFERMRRYMDQMMQAALRGQLEGSEGMNKPFVYGFSMRTGPDGRPVFQEFGNTDRVRRLNGRVAEQCPKDQAGAPSGGTHVSGREPLTDVIDCGSTVAVTVELPGVEKDDINLEVHEDSLTIKVDTESRRYFKEVDLMTPVKEETVKASYKNGVLDITFEKVKPEKRKGKKVPIE